MDVEYQHSCGVVLSEGEFDTYHVEKERVMWRGTAYCWVGECPACGGKLDPEEDRVLIEGR